MDRKIPKGNTYAAKMFHRAGGSDPALWNILMQLSLFDTPTVIASVTAATHAILDPEVCAILAQAVKGKMAKSKGLPRSVWDRFLQESGFDWKTGNSTMWHLPQDVLDIYGGNGAKVFRRGTIFRDRFVLRTLYANGVERLDDGDGNTSFWKDGQTSGTQGSGRVLAIQLCGYLPPCDRKASVPKGMKEKLIAAGVPAVCAVSGTSSNLEVDHKQGRPEEGIGWAFGPDPDLYQFLSKANNNVKKSACRRCIETGKRFDATMLGFPRHWTEGEATYDADQGCRGCYWFDVRAFHASFIVAQHDENG